SRLTNRFQARLSQRKSCRIRAPSGARRLVGGGRRGPLRGSVGLFPQEGGHVVVRFGERVVGLRADVGGEAAAPGRGGAGLHAGTREARQVDNLVRRQLLLA